ncbi:hypothetical protein M2475_001824 [Breznakia sp. PF5-3]|uniref:hypothetical protein n=1 Tax=unclassified Breznakia TaxID=2623764 RepID=UPI0024070ED6|nr:MULTISPECIES: hypothetical protein [unclassified Breznakia]MDF9825369.1 hypothetical protein [Breznakia sp. PM6-1]MDF9836247.1 hypothetical protein [Breznakia sp. PF5-3]MDF9838513.1 hypothetical protein [Breznakia sp. PFB2-8]MDF9860492.1 hypothetical protein [Breznakia sp. PH5-24]
MKSNKKFRSILANINHKVEDAYLINMKMDNLKKLFNPRFENIYGCIVFKNQNINLSIDDFNRLLKIYNDKTGFEANNNEIRVNDYIENDITVDESLEIALLLIDNWSLKLKKIDMKSEFCFIISCEPPYTTLRFHKVREDEALWISEELEKFDQPIGYTII